MIDIHPPQHTPITRRDFFIHLGIVVLGILIAIALEQSVEALHQAHQRAELRQALAHESQQILKDCRDSEKESTADLAWATAMGQQLSDAARLHHPVGLARPFPPSTANIPDDPIFRAAAASNQLALLSRSEIVSYSEVDSLLTQYRVLDQNAHKAYADYFHFQLAQTFAKPPGTLPFDGTSLQDLKTAYTLQGAGAASIQQLQRWARVIQGAEVAVSSGERDLLKIQASEIKYISQPSPAPPTEKP
ncbi:MAG: hypothetical protein WB439_15425 [Acidobacteriaceae bacterium]